MYWYRFIYGLLHFQCVFPTTKRIQTYQRIACSIASHLSEPHGARANARLNHVHSKIFDMQITDMRTMRRCIGLLKTKTNANKSWTAVCTRTGRAFESNFAQVKC